MGRFAVFVTVDFVSACLPAVKRRLLFHLYDGQRAFGAGGAASLMKAIRKEKRSVHEQGGGI